MARSELIFLLVSTLLVITESSYVSPTVRKCNSKDSECLKTYFQSVVQEAAQNGIPEADIPVLDPIDIKDYHVSIAGWVDFEFDFNGVGKGMKTCVIDKFWMNFDKRCATVEVICDLSMAGHYKMFTNSSLVRNLFDGDIIHGDGDGALKFEKMKIMYDFHFKVEQRGEDYYVNANFDNSKYAFDILRKAVFSADNLYLGKHEASELIIRAMNQHWKPIMDGSGLQFMYKVRKIFYDWTQKYFNTTPVKNYLTDDVSPYVVL